MNKNLPIRKDHDIVEIMRKSLQHKFLKIFHDIGTNNNKDNNDDNDLGKGAKKMEVWSFARGLLTLHPVLAKDQPFPHFFGPFSSVRT